MTSLEKGIDAPGAKHAFYRRDLASISLELQVSEHLASQRVRVGLSLLKILIASKPKNPE